MFHGWFALWLVDDSPGPLQRQFSDLRLGTEFRLVAEEHSSNCIAGCRLVDRYFVSDLTVEKACSKVGPQLAVWGDVHPDQTPPGVGIVCSFAGSKASYDVVAQVKKDMTVDSQREITEAHQSVLFIGLSEG